jgi:hypothetical protein
MTRAFASALDALFADAHLARDVVYTAEGGAPALVRAMLRRPDDITGFGDARHLVGDHPGGSKRLAEVPNPAARRPHRDRRNGSGAG